MQTTLASFLDNTPEGEVAASILRKCVHCGFCTATCPTYQLTGDELDGPRGRIYQIKAVVEGAPPTDSIRQHLDRCLTCRACETTCPSGVQYGKLVDIGREIVDRRHPRPLQERIQRAALRKLMLHPTAFHGAWKTGVALRQWLPENLRDKLRPAPPAKSAPRHQHARKMIMLGGCVQPTMAPNIHAASARVLDRLGIELVSSASAGCCGAVNQHTGDPHSALDDMRRNIDAWWPLIEAGAQAIVIDASGCSLMVKEYDYHLRLDAAYADKAQRVSELARDISQIVLAEVESGALKPKNIATPALAYHPPCTLQHGQKLSGVVEKIFTALEIPLMVPKEAHLCCGSAGTYAFLQPAFSHALRTRKLGHLNALAPERIVSANIGCISQLQSGTKLPVGHWIEFLDEYLDATR